MNLLKYIVVATFSVLLFACAGTKPGYDFGTGKTMLWKVSDANSHVWLFGSIHFADSSFYPFPKIVEDAFASSMALAAELDISNGETVAENQQEMLAKGVLPQGKTLKDVLPDTLWVPFDSICKSWGVPSQTFMQFRPWMAATLLSTYAFMRAGINPELGVDAVLLERANEAEKEVIALETPEEQMSALSADTSDEEGIYYMASTLDEIGRMDSMISNIKNAWKTGDVATLRRELDSSSEEPKNKHEENIEKRVLDDRNIKMARNVEEFLANDREVFVVIGVGHLILGENHVLEILKDKGYKIERY